MKKSLLHPPLVIAFLCVALGSAYAGGSLAAFCGAATKPVMEEAAALFTERTATPVDLRFSGSGAMLSQLKMARRGDVYLAGSPDYMVKADRDGVIDPRTITPLAYLIIAINVEHGNPKNIRTLADLAAPGIRIGIGNPEAVTLGGYAVELLDRNGLLTLVRKNIVTHAPSASALAGLLVMKKVDAVLGWTTFSRWNPDKIGTVPITPALIPRLAYYCAAVARYSHDPASAERFIAFLASPDVKKIFEKWGYVTTEYEAREWAPSAEIGGDPDISGYTNP